MVFAVVLDVPPLEAAAAARTLSTCNAALGPEQCVLADTIADSRGAAHWYAVVRYGSDGQARLTIELYPGNRQGGRVASSELEFEERDSPEERWASAGVVVAALVAAQPAIQSSTDQKPAPVAPVQPAAIATPPSAARRSAGWRLDLGVTAGSEVRSAPLRVGPLGRFGIAFSSLPVFACSSLAYTVGRSQSTDLTWLTGSLGAGARVGFARERAALELRAELVLERLGIQATDGERSESARRTRFGPRFGLDLSGYWTKNWALLVGAEAGAVGPRVVLDVNGQSEDLPPFVWGLLSAVRYDIR
ncbi:MAG TPA: hypothetical protein VJV79_25285 [Polyangiaceae bacterium]|nr:hypothetical protein [Polyangiaceae bacterium]